MIDNLSRVLTIKKQRNHGIGLLIKYCQKYWFTTRNPGLIDFSRSFLKKMDEWSIEILSNLSRKHLSLWRSSVKTSHLFVNEKKLIGRKFHCSMIIWSIIDKITSDFSCVTKISDANFCSSLSQTRATNDLNFKQIRKTSSLTLICSH